MMFELRQDLYLPQFPQFPQVPPADGAIHRAYASLHSEASQVTGHLCEEWDVETPVANNWYV